MKKLTVLFCDCMRKFALVGWFFVCLPLFGWGPEGHVLVARIAETELTPAVRARVLEILGPGNTMESVSIPGADSPGRDCDTAPYLSGRHNTQRGGSLP